MENLNFINFLFIVANFIWFFSLNNKFSKTYRIYRGWLWSLLFFPTFFICSTIFNALLWIAASMTNFNEMKTGIICFIIGLAIVITLFINFNKLQNNLFNWTETTIQNGTKYFRNIVMLGLAGQIVNTVFYFTMFKYVWMSLLGMYGDWIEIIGWFVDGFASMVGFDSGLIATWLIIYQIIVALVYLWIFNAGKTKLSILNRQILNPESYQNSSMQLSPHIPVSPYYSGNYPNSQSSKIEEEKEMEVKYDNTTKLIELKQLLDDGVLSEDEFNKMKKEILKEGL